MKEYGLAVKKRGESLHIVYAGENYKEAASILGASPVEMTEDEAREIIRKQSQINSELKDRI